MHGRVAIAVDMQADRAGPVREGHGEGAGGEMTRATGCRPVRDYRDP